MEFLKYSYKIQVEFCLTRLELEHLIRMSKLHYDSTCKETSEVGGFIYGWNIRMDNKEKVEVEASIRQLDLITKILEIEHFNYPGFNLSNHIKAFNQPSIKNHPSISLSNKFNEMTVKAIEESNRIKWSRK